MKCLPPAQGGIQILGKDEVLPLLCTWQSLRCWSCLRFTGLWIFLEDDFWYSVFSSPWFDSGYTLRQFMRLFGRLSHISSCSTRSTLSTSCLCLPSECGFGMCMYLADPVSSGKYSGTLVLTAPVAEPIVVSYTVPLNGNTIVDTATGVTSYSSSADCFGSAAPLCCESVASRCRVVVVLSPGGTYDSVLGQCEAVTGNYFINYFLYQEFVGCICLLNYWFSSYDEICQTTTTIPGSS